MSARPYTLGLTGSIGMGKSTTAKMFAEAGIPVWDADAAVHRLYDTRGAGAAAVSVIAPQAVTEGRVDRDRLREAIAAEPALLSRIEAVIHPLVARDREQFLGAHASSPIVLFDIPLLFETGADGWLDGIVVVTAPEAVQRDRVLARPGMSETHFQRILARQTPDSEKRDRADYLVHTDRGLEPARAEVRAILADIATRQREKRDA